MEMAIFPATREQLSITRNAGDILSALITNSATLLNGLSKSASTIRAYTSNVKPFLAYIEKYGVSPKTFQDYRKALQLEVCSIATKNARMAAAGALLREAYRERILPIDITKDVSGFKASRGHKKTGHTTMQVRSSLAAIAEKKSNRTRAKYSAMFALMAYEGFRQCEVTRLTVGDVNLTDSIVMVHGKGKDDKEPFPVTAQTVEALASWLEIHDGGTYLFPGNGGREMTTAAIRKAFKGVFDGAGIQGKSVHGLRHWAITETLRATNGNLATTRRRSRHSGFAMLEIYDDARLGAGDAALMGAHIAACIG